MRVHRFREYSGQLIIKEAEFLFFSLVMWLITVTREKPGFAISF